MLYDRFCSSILVEKDNTKRGIPLTRGGGKVDLDLWLRDPKINRVPLLIIHNLHVKFDGNWT